MEVALAEPFDPFAGEITGSSSRLGKSISTAVWRGSAFWGCGWSTRCSGSAGNDPLDGYKRRVTVSSTLLPGREAARFRVHMASARSADRRPIPHLSGSNCASGPGV